MTCRFGLYEFDDATGELRRQGRPVRLEPQPARALAPLLSRAGETVRREEMRAHLWDAGTHVDFDRGLAYCIGQVRTALGDSADNPRFVETIPKRGHRFIAPAERVGPAVSPVPAAGSSPQGTAAEVAMPSLTSSVWSGTASRSWWPVAAITLLVVGAVGWTAWARMAPARPIVAVAVFDNETGATSFDPLARTAADIMVDRLTGWRPRHPAHPRQPRGVSDGQTSSMTR